MRKRRGYSSEAAKRKERALKSLRLREQRFKRALSGDEDALMECMYEAGIFGKDALEDYYKIKEQYGC